jgi:hypothetical protein
MLQARMASIDHVREEIMKPGEKRCRKLNMGAVDYSPFMVDLGRRVELYGLVLKHRLTNRISTTNIRRKAAKLKILKPLSVTLEEVESNYKAALDEYALFKPDAAVYRYKFLTARKDDPDKPEEDHKAVDTLLNKEKSHQLSRSLRCIKNQPHLGAISKVEVETTTGSPPTIYDTQATVKQAIMESLDARYRMSHHSQFLQLLEQCQSRLSVHPYRCTHLKISLSHQIKIHGPQ